MNIFSNLLVTKITIGGFWADLFNWIATFIPSYGWIIILVTLLIKLLLSPLEFMQKTPNILQMKKKHLVQPEVQKIYQKYGNNKELIQRKVEEVYRKAGVNQVQPGGFKGTFIYLILSMVILISLFSSVGTISKNVIKTEFTQMQNTYTTVYNYYKFEQGSDNLSDYYTNKYNEFVDEYVNNYNEETMQEYATGDAYATAMAENDIINIAQVAVLDGVTLVGAGENGSDLVLIGYNDMVEGWLWVKNVWRPDSSVSAFPSAEEFIVESGISFNIINSYVLADPSASDEDCIIEVIDGQTIRFAKENGEKVVDYSYYYVDMQGNYYYSAEYINAHKTGSEEDITEEAAKNLAKAAFVADYEAVAGEVLSVYNKQNGCYVLLLLLCVLIFVSSKVSYFGIKVKNKKGEVEKLKVQTAGNGMILFMIGLMLLLSYNRPTIFSLYLIVQYIVSIPINIVINLISNTIQDKKEEKEADVKVADYVRR